MKNLMSKYFRIGPCKLSYSFIPNIQTGNFTVQVNESNSGPMLFQKFCGLSAQSSKAADTLRSLPPEVLSTLLLNFTLHCEYSCRTSDSAQAMFSL